MHSEVPAPGSHFTGPTVSVVLTGGWGRPELAAALAAGVPRCRNLGVRIRVLHTDESLGREMGLRFPDVQWLTIAAGMTEPERRAAGFAAVGTDIVIFAQPQDLEDEDWLEALAWRVRSALGRGAEPSREWAALLAKQGAPGALGDI